MEYLIAIGLFVVGLGLIIYGGDKFVDSAVYVAKVLKIPEIVIGATIVSLGTTLPEIMVSVIAAFNGNGAIAAGNALGSIIFNTGVIAGITQIFMPGKVDSKSFNWRVVFFFGTLTLLYVLGSQGNVLTRTNGLILVGGLIIYLLISLFKKDGGEDEHHEEIEKDPKELTKSFIMLVFSAFLIFVGAQFMVDNAVFLAESVGISERVIGLTIVAFGTSLPELVTAINAIVKKHMNISLGNIIGANLLNILAVCGLSASIGEVSMASTVVVNIPVAFAVMGVLCIPPLFYKKTFKWQGYVLLGMYVCYFIYLFMA